MAEDYGAAEAGQLPRAWTIGRKETESRQRASGAKSSYLFRYGLSSSLQQSSVKAAFFKLFTAFCEALISLGLAESRILHAARADTRP